MKKAMLLAGFFVLGSLTACMGQAPKVPRSFSSADAKAQKLVAATELLVNKNQCTSTKMILASVQDSEFTWGSNKGTAADATVETPVIGTTGMAGCIFPNYEKLANGSMGQSLARGFGQFDFNVRSTNSFNTLRDNRIIQYIFGYDIPEDPEGLPSNTDLTKILSVKLDAISGADLKVPTVVGDTVALKVSGTLKIAGFSVPIEVPVALTKTSFGFNVENNENFTLNVRGGKQSLNTLGLDERVTAILALVTPGTLQDMIDVKFSVDFVDLCAAP